MNFQKFSSFLAWGRMRKLVHRLFLISTKLRHKKLYSEMLLLNERQQRFSKIYENNLWSSGESRSGTGSELYFTYPIRTWLTRNIPRLGINKFVDAPCGDFHWMREVINSLDCDYVGVDIVDFIIKENQHKYSTNRVNFVRLDMCESPLPDCDLLMVRDCLFHLSFNDIDKVLQNLARTNYRYLLTTTHSVSTAHTNTDIVTGDFRKIDIFKWPFDFQRNAIIEEIPEFSSNGKHVRSLVLFAKSDVPQNCYKL